MKSILNALKDMDRPVVKEMFEMKRTAGPARGFEKKLPDYPEGSRCFELGAEGSAEGGYL